MKKIILTTTTSAMLISMFTAGVFLTTHAPAAENLTESTEWLQEASKTPEQQELRTVTGGPRTIETPALQEFMMIEEATPHNFNVEAAIKAAYSEVGTSRATGWGAPGECIESVKRWITAGDGKWGGAGTPPKNYSTAKQIDLTYEPAKPGDVIQYLWEKDENDWVAGIHTILITGVNKDGTYKIVESNVPTGSGRVTSNDSWTPKPPKGFRAVVYRF